MGKSTQRSETVDGILLLDKPAGMTSNQALQKVKRLLGAKNEDIDSAEEIWAFLSRFNRPGIPATDNPTPQ